MSNSKSTHVYVGKLFYRKNPDHDLNIPAKKIGKTNAPSTREYNTDASIILPVGFVIVKAWHTGKHTDKVEKSLQKVLGVDTKTGEWVDDEHDDLVSRVSDYMEEWNYQPATENELKSPDESAQETQVRQAELTKTELREKRIENIDKLRGHEFTLGTGTREITIRVDETDVNKLTCMQTGVIFTDVYGGLPNLNKAFRVSYEKVTGGDLSIHAWAGPTNKDGNTPDKVMGIEY